MRTPVFELHILPLFRATDRDHMLFALDLWDYAKVVEHADEILARVEIDMPTIDTGGPWPEEWVQIFRRWRDTGFKRLEMGTGAQYMWSQSATAASIRATGTFPAAGYRGWLQIESLTETAKTYVLFFEAPDEPTTGLPDSFNIRERYPVADTRSVFIRDAAGLQQVH